MECSIPGRGGALGGLTFTAFDHTGGIAYSDTVIGHRFRHDRPRPDGGTRTDVGHYSGCGANPTVRTDLDLDELASGESLAFPASSVLSSSAQHLYAGGQQSPVADAHPPEDAITANIHILPDLGLRVGKKRSKRKAAGKIKSLECHAVIGSAKVVADASRSRSKTLGKEDKNRLNASER